MGRGEGWEGRGGDRDGRGEEGRGYQSVRRLQPITLIVCVGMEVSCKPS